MFQKTFMAALIFAATVTGARAENSVLGLPVSEPGAAQGATTEAEAMTEAISEAATTPQDGTTPQFDSIIPAGEWGTRPTKKLTRREKYDRGLAFDTATPSMPKGLWVAGINIGYSQLNTEDYRFLIIEKANTKGHSLNLSPMVHYVFANNQSIGLRFSYKRNWIDIPHLKLNLTDALNTMLFTDGHIKYEYLSHTYMAYFSYRYYVGFGSSMRRLLFFNEVQLGFGGGQQRERSGEPPAGSSDLFRTGTFQNSFNFRVGLSPGISFFVTNVLAIELQIGLLGYELKQVNQWTTGGLKSSMDTHSVSTRFDFLSIAFGTTFYL